MHSSVRCASARFGLLCSLLVLFVLSVWQSAHADWLRQSSGFRGGFILSLGNFTLKGKENDKFNSTNGLKLSGSYMNALNKDIYESQIIYFEYGMGYVAYSGEDTQDETCVINDTSSSCTVTNNIKIIDLNASSLFFWHINDYVSLFGRLGVGYSLTTIDQVATRPDGAANQSSDSVANFSPILGVGVLVSKRIKIEFLQYTVGGDVESAKSQVAIVPGTYTANEIRLSIVLPQ